MGRILLSFFARSLLISFVLSAFLVGEQDVLAAKKQRKFYLTQDTFTGNHALTACADGYHMASLWEIFDVTSLTYERTLGRTQTDSGFGPPTLGGAGWIRTGFSSSDAEIPGNANCLSWTSDTGPGTTVALGRTWNQPATIISPWEAFLDACNDEVSVWCVED